MRFLLISPEIQSEVDKVLLFAEQEENWYRPTPADYEELPSGDTRRPGNNPNYQIQLGSYHCIFSYTETEQGIFKQLSVRVPGAPPNTAPMVVAVEEIAKMFKFNEDPRYWQLSLDNCRPACAVVLEPIEVKDPVFKAQWDEVLKSRGI